MRGLKFDKVYTSDLSRAFKTAGYFLEASGQQLIPIQVAELRERSFGIYEGELGSDHPEMRQLALNDYNYIPEGGESIAQVMDRVAPFFENVLKPALLRGENILLVGHSVSCSMLMCVLEGLTWDEWDGKRDCLPTAGKALYHVTAEGIARIS